MPLSSSSSSHVLASSSDFVTYYASMQAFVRQHDTDNKERTNQRERPGEREKEGAKNTIEKAEVSFSSSWKSTTSDVLDTADLGQDQGHSQDSVQAQSLGRGPDQHQRKPAPRPESFLEQDRVWVLSSPPSATIMISSLHHDAAQFAELPSEPTVEGSSEVSDEVQEQVSEKVSFVRSEGEQRSSIAGPAAEQTALEEEAATSEPDPSEGVQGSFMKTESPDTVEPASEEHPTTSGDYKVVNTVPDPPKPACSSPGWGRSRPAALCNNWDDFFSKIRATFELVASTTKAKETTEETTSVEQAKSSISVTLPQAVATAQALDHTKLQTDDNHTQPLALQSTPVDPSTSSPRLHESLAVATTLSGATKNLLDDVAEHEVLNTSKFPTILFQSTRRSSECDAVSAPPEHDLVSPPLVTRTSVMRASLVSVSGSKWAPSKSIKTIQRSSACIANTSPGTPSRLEGCSSSTGPTTPLGPKSTVDSRPVCQPVSLAHSRWAHSRWATSLDPFSASPPEPTTPKPFFGCKEAEQIDNLPSSQLKEITSINHLSDQQHTRVHPTSELRCQPLNGAVSPSSACSANPHLPPSWKVMSPAVVNCSLRSSMSENLDRFRAEEEDQKLEKVRYTRPYLLAFSRYKAPPATIDKIQGIIKDGNNMRGCGFNFNSELSTPISPLPSSAKVDIAYHSPVPPLPFNPRDESDRAPTPPATSSGSQRFVGSKSGRFGGIVLNFKQPQPIGPPLELDNRAARSVGFASRKAP